MRFLILATLGFTGASLAATPSFAWHLDFRVVERHAHPVLPPPFPAVFRPGTAHRLPLQINAVDDFNGPAPASGVGAWRGVGNITTTGNGIWTRTPGRLEPWTSSQDPEANGVP